MIHRDDVLRELFLEDIRMLTRFETLSHDIDLLEGHISRELIVVENEIISDCDEFLIHIEWRIIDEDTVRLALAHLFPISADEEFGREDILFWETVSVHEGTTSKEIEVLIISPEFDITRTIFPCDRY